MNRFCPYCYYWEFKVHKLETQQEEDQTVTNSLLRGPYKSGMQIGFQYCNENEYELNKISSQYCNGGFLTVDSRHTTKYGQSFGRNDFVSVSLNTVTTEVRFGVNGCDQGIAFKMNEYTEPMTQIKLHLNICGPHVEIEIVKFDRYTVR